MLCMCRLGCRVRTPDFGIHRNRIESFKCKTIKFLGEACMRWICVPFLLLLERLNIIVCVNWSLSWHTASRLIFSLFFFRKTSNLIRFWAHKASSYTISAQVLTRFLLSIAAPKHSHLNTRTGDKPRILLRQNGIRKSFAIIPHMNMATEEKAWDI